ncbi:hypothetical protein EJB05_31388, partial [Eragrostis curvula]
MGASPSRHEESTASSRVGDGHAVPVATGSSTSGSNQAQSKRAPPPHKFNEIIAQEMTATGIFLAGKTKARTFKCFVDTLWQYYLTKYWVHEKTRGNCFMLFPRALYITWGEDPRYWSWHLLKETSDTEIEAVSLKNVCWLEIHGKLESSHLTPGVTYEVVFEVMLTKQAYGWTVPVNLRLKLPNGTVQERNENLQEKPRGQWLQLKVGEVKAEQGLKGEMEVSLFEYGGQWKKGLFIKGIRITPKEKHLCGMLKDLQTVSEVVSGVRQSKERSSMDNGVRTKPSVK